MKIEFIKQDDQRTKDWRIERLGKFTGSRISDLMKAGRKKDEAFGDTAKSLIYEVMAERDLSSDTLGNEDIWDKYLDLTTAHSKPMQFGTDNEDDAISSFEDWLHNNQDAISINGHVYLTKKLEVIRGGSQDHPSIANFSASPDAVIYDIDNGDVVACLETKVPLPKTFLQYRSEVKDADTLKSVKLDYYYQVHAEMMVTDTKVCFFVAYNPFLIHSLHVTRIDADEEVFANITNRLSLAEEFIASLNA